MFHRPCFAVSLSMWPFKININPTITHFNDGMRSTRIDAMKGIAIMLVVLGHAIQNNIADFDNNIVFRAIYSFHMPLFMFLSGYLALNKEINLKRKFMALVLPFVAWHLLNYVIIPSNQSVEFSTYITRWIKSPDYGLWFLWVLFINFCILFAVQRSSVILGDKGESATLLAAAFFLQLLPVNVLGLGLVKWHFIFFGAGYYISGTKERSVTWKRPLSSMSIVCFPLLALTWYRTHGPSFEAAMNNIFNSLSLPGAPLLLIAYKFVVPFLGIAFCFTLIPVSGKARFYSMLTFLGTITMDVYVVHQNVLFGFGTGIWKVTSAFAVALALSVVVSFIFRRSQLLSLLFLGRKIREQDFVSGMA
jgi:fucose 4-O-acetylase-like acetyltransferase